MTQIFVGDLERETLDNRNFRKVISTTRQQQLVLMSLKPKESIGSEVHTKTDQFIRIESGVCLAEVGSRKFRLTDGMSVTIPAGFRHNIINHSQTQRLQLYTIYSPPEHPPDTVIRNKPKN